jgi:hypothetical protein
VKLKDEGLGMNGMGVSPCIEVSRIDGASQAAEKGEQAAISREEIPSGLKPSVYFQPFSARLKSRRDTSRGAE